MCFRKVLFLTALFIKIAIVEETKRQYVLQGNRTLDDILLNLEERQELRAQIRELESQLKVKELQLQNTIWQGTSSPIRSLPKNCKEIQDRENTGSNIFRIQPDSSSKPFLVFCDMVTQGGGWTYVMNRFNGSQDFDLSWSSYQDGFGQLTGEFWLGLENLHKLTASGPVNELLVELIDWDEKRATARYSSFSIGSDQEGYQIQLATQYSGDAGDALSKHVGSKFSTKDNDQDNDLTRNCASDRHGGWWYKSCFFCKLTGKYLREKLSNNERYKGIHWDNFHDTYFYSLKEARMMVRPRASVSPMPLPHEQVN